MRPEDIIKLLRAQPFRPFRVFLSDGSQYDVRHPEMAIVDRSVVTVGVPGPGGLDAPMERTVLVALIHINKAEHVDIPDGSPARRG